MYRIFLNAAPAMAAVLLFDSIGEGCPRQVRWSRLITCPAAMGAQQHDVSAEQ